MKYYCKNCGTEFRFRDNIWNDDNCPVCGNDDPDYELFYIPDYETPAQYEKRTGKAFSDDGLVWMKLSHEMEWVGNTLYGVQQISNKTWPDPVEHIVIADPPVPPPDGWKPEEEVTA